MQNRRSQHRGFVITTDSTRPIDDVARELAAAGLDKVQTLREIGVIAGHAAGSAEARFRAIAGVSNVAFDAPVRVEPPESDPLDRSTW